MIRITCPTCKTAFKLGMELAGKRIKCKSCGTILGVPVIGAVPKKAAAPASVAGAAQPAATAGEEAITPYAVGPVHEVPAEVRDFKVDQMVRTAQRQKRRNRVWGLIGMPATYLKWWTLIMFVVFTISFLWWTMGCVLKMHKHELAQQAGKVLDARTMRDARWVWPLEDIFASDDAPGFVFGLGAAVYFPSAILFGLTLMGAEKMRRLENYGWALTGAIVGVIVCLPLGMICVVRLMDKEVQHEFEISRMRAEGIDWETIEDEEEARAKAEAEAEAEDEDGEGDAEEEE
jgi:hypothetical protein